MRVHAAVAGRHSRHGQLLPLEVYLEEGIPLVRLHCAQSGQGFPPHPSIWAGEGPIAAQRVILSSRGSPALLERSVPAPAAGVPRMSGYPSAVSGPLPQRTRVPSVPHHPSRTASPPQPPQVLHMRNYPFATLCELCEQSMHAFVSCSTVACSPPALKVGGARLHAVGACCGCCLVLWLMRRQANAMHPLRAVLFGFQVSCNDCDLLWELDSCYWLEKLACMYSVGGGGTAVLNTAGSVACFMMQGGLRQQHATTCHVTPFCPLHPTPPPLVQHLELFPEEGLPPDKADEWVMSPYLLKK